MEYYNIAFKDEIAVLGIQFCDTDSNTSLWRPLSALQIIFYLLNSCRSFSLFVYCFSLSFIYLFSAILFHALIQNKLHCPITHSFIANKCIIPANQCGGILKMQTMVHVKMCWCFELKTAGWKCKLLEKIPSC